MRRPSRDATITLGFVALSFALAFWQRPGDATSDTKIDLHVDPAAFLDRVLSAWNPSSTWARSRPRSTAGSCGR